MSYRPLASLRIRWHAWLMVLTAGPWTAAAVDPVAQVLLLPGRLETYVSRAIRLTSAERRTLASGGSVTRVLEGDPSREVGVFGAIWVSAPVNRSVSAVIDIERFETGGAFRKTRKISEPARVEDFAELSLTPGDVADLETCRVGSCELKLGDDALARIRAEVDWSRGDGQAQAEALMRRLAVRPW